MSTVATRLPISAVLLVEAAVMLVTGVFLFGVAVFLNNAWGWIALGVLLLWNAMLLFWLAARARNMETHPQFAVLLLHADEP